MNKNKLLKVEKNAFKHNLPLLNSLLLDENFLDGLDESNYVGLASVVYLEINNNQIKILNSQFLNNFELLSEFHLSHNDLRHIDPFSFKRTNYLSTLSLDFNRLSHLVENVFFNLKKLKFLYLNENEVVSIDGLKSNLNFLINLEFIDLASNQIENINEKDFNFSLKLKNINLNYNKIKFIHASTFLQLSFLDTLKMAKTQMNILNLTRLQFHTFSKFIELDLSFNQIEMWNQSRISKSIQRLKLENVQFVNNLTFDFFLNKILLAEIDLSKNNFDFKILNVLSKLERLVLRNVNLESMTQIDFQNFPQLSYLDLSFNKLTDLKWESFKNLLKLVHLDLSYNQISFIESQVFIGLDSRVQVSKWIRLDYLNLEHNQIANLDNFILSSSNGVEILVLSNNLLAQAPYFYDVGSLNEVYLSRNKFLNLGQSLFSAFAYNLKTINLNTNEIGFIKSDLFFNLKKLQNLSLAQNSLTKVEASYFINLNRLEYLNLSQNLIEIIEMNSFQNLNRLLTLDLSFNRLKLLKNELFYGLNELTNLYLMNNSRHFYLENRTFSPILNTISNIYLDFSIINEFKCLFMISIERLIRRRISNKYIFYKSINLISNFNNDTLNWKQFCAVKFQLFQFNFHLNLKTDLDFQHFFDVCNLFLINKSNSYEINLKNCNLLNSQKIEDILTVEDSFNFLSFKVLTNFMYLFTMIMLLTLFIPMFFVIVCIKNLR